eukprot:CAMPEP_0202965236 /NCGR_PEP_ID=MMETSP1396-20130829/9279_1 /ASSEMBLY_ACC=CAM_ASM_000872 /TAXON_ID= /ORGANISM="Pseudokeronopsis sp., Strain Brazil" /LENGTH=99 /DNA_ID=CAMNT_0049687887 /DNA_START=383 /DNA_END=682 /DNA_ORIENTATION=+
MPEKVLQRVGLHLFTGLKAIHDLESSHNDIKKDNVFVTYDVEKFGEDLILRSWDDVFTYDLRFVIGDLGLCMLHHHNEEFGVGTRGTPFYYAPEKWEKQ